MRVAADVMEPAREVPPDLSIPAVARILVEEDLDGVCVVDEGRLVGVVTAMDLVFRERKVRTPVVVALLDAVLSFGADRTRKDLEKIGAVRVSGLMTPDPVTVGPATPLDEVATRMVDEHLSVVPVLDGDRVVGVVSRHSMVRATLREVASAPPPPQR